MMKRQKEEKYIKLSIKLLFLFIDNEELYKQVNEWI